MDKKFDAVIVSIFGRADWLAAELSQRGMNICLIDISKQMGAWAPEDWEGPFGLFRNSDVWESQIHRYHQDHYIVQAEKGFCLWPANGPVEFKGPNYKFQKDKSVVSVNCDSYLQDYSTLNELQKQKLLESIQNSSFEKDYIAYLSHQICANLYAENIAALSIGQPAAVYSNYYMRRSSRQSLKLSLASLQSNAVNVIEEPQVLDLSFSEKKFSGIEISVQERSQFIQAENLVWCLSSYESSLLNKNILEKLFQSKVIQPSWSWVRYQMHFEKTHLLQALPIQFVNIDDIRIPWVLENLMYFNQREVPGQYDCWLRIPNQQRFQKEYLLDIKQKIIQVMSKKIPHNMISEVLMPPEHQYGFTELGACRFPVYAGNELSLQNKLKLKTLIFAGPDTWPALDPRGQFLHFQKVFANIFDWKVKQLELEAKNDRTLQP